MRDESLPDEVPSWFDLVVKAMPPENQAEFLLHWRRLRMHNDNDELLAIAHFHGWLTAVMMTIPEQIKEAVERPVGAQTDNARKLLELVQKTEKVLKNESFNGSLQKTMDVLHLSRSAAYRYSVHNALTVGILCFLLGAASMFIFLIVK